MTTTEFKNKCPQYSHLEGDELWDKMTEYVFTEGEQYTADPNREIIYHEPVTLSDGQEVYVEDDSKTMWINSKGEKVLLELQTYEPTVPTSYKMIIWDAADNKDRETVKDPYEGLTVEEKFEKFRKEQENIESWRNSSPYDK